MAYNGFGFVLCRPNGAPLFWSESERYVVLAYAYFARRVMLNADDFDLEKELARLRADGWIIKQAQITLNSDDHGKPKQSKTKSKPDSAPIQKRRIERDIRDASADFRRRRPDVRTPAGR